MSKVQAAQLLARGVQDAWLSGEPQVSFYRSRFKRHAPFALTIERFLVPIDGKILMNPKSDLLGYTYLTAHDPTTGALVPNADWSNIVSTVELVIGNQTIATHDLTYINTIQKVLEADTYSKRSSTPFQPLGFFFDRQALPLVALKYTDVRINITWASTAAATQYLYRCWSHCVHLDEDERRFFATQRHQMLVPQIQRIPVSNEPLFHGPLKYIAAPCINYAYVYVPNVQIAATGGAITTYSSGGTTYKVHTFTTTGTFTVTAGGNVDVLIVGGGGGGSAYTSQGFYGGGGGGGQVVYQTNLPISIGSYIATVGSGGYRFYDDSSGPVAAQGSSVFSLNALPGQNAPNYTPLFEVNGGASGSGNPGGVQTYPASTPFWPTGGGGGDSQSGNNNGTGGNGTINSISGTPVYYGGGGGGGWNILYNPATGWAYGGLGGGGNGGGYPYYGIEQLATPGSPNTGGGGGGGWYGYGGYSGAPMASGGSGIIIIRYTI